MEEKNLNWAVIGCGVIANEMAQALEKMNRTLYSVANRTYEKAIDFAKNITLKRFTTQLKRCFATLMWTLSI